MKRIMASSSKIEIKKCKHDAFHFVGETMKKMLDDKVMSDFVLISGKDGQKFDVHKLVLATTSDYFNARFKSNFPDNNTKEHIVEDVDGPTLKKIVDCCYTGDLALNGLCVYDIVTVANYLRIEYIEKRCIDYLSRKLSWKNCVSSYRTADMFSLNTLKTDSFAMICKELKRIDPNQLRQMDDKLILEVLKSDKIEADEEMIFRKLKEWVEGNETDNSKYVPELMEHIKLEHISGSFLLNTVWNFGRKYQCLKPSQEATRRILQFNITAPTQRYTPAPTNFPPGVKERNGNFMLDSPSSIGSSPSNVHV